MQTDYYKILGLLPSASPGEIKKAYHLLAKKYHPDTNGGDAGAAELFKEVNEAYHILSDQLKKSNYDLRFKTGFVFIKPDFEPYLAAIISSHSAKLNEEFEITYRYAGEGRIFKRPELSSLFYNSSPVIEHRNIMIGQAEIKETSMTFTVSALNTGMLSIPPASIYINHRPYYSTPLKINITPAHCFFKKEEQASHRPYITYLHKEHQTKSTYQRTYIYRHHVLIPRSNYAFFYHQVGSTIKTTFTILGFFGAIAFGFSIILGFLTGSLAGGIVCHSMYLFAGIRSKFYNDIKYPSVIKYFEEGYFPGREPGYGIFNRKEFYLFISLFR